MRVYRQFRLYGVTSFQRRWLFSRRILKSVHLYENRPRCIYGMHAKVHIKLAFFPAAWMAAYEPSLLLLLLSSRRRIETEIKLVFLEAATAEVSSPFVPLLFLIRPTKRSNGKRTGKTTIHRKRRFYTMGLEAFMLHHAVGKLRLPCEIWITNQEKYNPQAAKVISLFVCSEMGHILSPNNAFR